MRNCRPVNAIGYDSCRKSGLMKNRTRQTEAGLFSGLRTGPALAQWRESPGLLIRRSGVRFPHTATSPRSSRGESALDRFAPFFSSLRKGILPLGWVWAEGHISGMRRAIPHHVTGLRAPDALLRRDPPGRGVLLMGTPDSRSAFHLEHIAQSKAREEQRE